MLDPVSANAFWPEPGELTLPIGGGGHVGEARKQRRHSASNRLLYNAAVKAQRGSDLGDHVRGQELHHNRDEICGHGDLSILILVVR